MSGRRLTTDEYLWEPETLLPQELVYGVVRDAPAPHGRHQRALGAFYLALTTHVMARGLGEVLLSPIDVVLDRERHLVAQPDLIFVSAGRQIVTDRVWGPPDMVLEVLSPHPRIGRLDERIVWFAEHGVRECWLFHQLADRLEILTFTERRIGIREEFLPAEAIRSAVLPDFRRTLSDIVQTTRQP